MSFEDSTLPPLQQALAEGELTMAEAYETEYELVNRPVLKWDLEGAATLGTALAPRQKLPIWVTCLGKEGWYVCTFLAATTWSETSSHLVPVQQCAFITRLRAGTRFQRPNHSSCGRCRTLYSLQYTTRLNATRWMLYRTAVL